MGWGLIALFIYEKSLKDVTELKLPHGWRQFPGWNGPSREENEVATSLARLLRFKIQTLGDKNCWEINTLFKE